jgi:hypothetical protein
MDGAASDGRKSGAPVGSDGAQPLTSTSETARVDTKASFTLRADRMDSDSWVTCLNDMDYPPVHVETAGAAWCDLPFEVNEIVPAFDFSNEAQPH